MSYNSFNINLDDDGIKNNSDFMLDNWTPNSMDLLDSIFDTELLNFDEIDYLSSSTSHIKDNNQCHEDSKNFIFNTSDLITTHENESDCKTTVVAGEQISSNSSDSGLSSDNLDMDVSPEYEPFSPAVSSPGPSISERGEKNSPQRSNNESFTSTTSSPSSYSENLFTQEDEEEGGEIEIVDKTVKITDKNTYTLSNLSPTSSSLLSSPLAPKVVFEKIPKVYNLPTKRILANQIESSSSQDKSTPIKIIKLSPQQSLNGVNSNNKRITIQLKNPNLNVVNVNGGIGGGKIQPKSGTLLINNKGKVTEVKKLIPVQTATTNPRSILLPVTLQDMKGLKTYKVLNMSTLKSYGNANKTLATNIALKSVKESNTPKPMKLKIQKEESYSDQNMSDVESIIYEDIKNEDTDDYIEDCSDDVDIESNASTTNSPYPKLILTTEEKKLLAKEGITLPSHYPLTKYEERELKRIRRKIRNKISAQDSRKRKKEYVDGLEERVKQCTEENQTLLKKIKLLHQQNQNLMSQMKKLQTLLSKGTNKTAHPTTCLLVLLLSLALVATPNLKFGQNEKEIELNDVTSDDITSDVLQNRRNLLFDTKEQHQQQNSAELFDEDIVSDLITMNNHNDIVNGAKELLNNCKLFNNYNETTNNESSACKKMKNFIDFDVDEINWYQLQEIQNMQQKQTQNLHFENAANEYQKNKSQQQTSGFNINGGNVDNNDNHNGILSKNILEILDANTISTAGLYSDLNIHHQKLGNIETITSGAHRIAE